MKKELTTKSVSAKIRALGVFLLLGCMLVGSYPAIVEATMIPDSKSEKMSLNTDPLLRKQWGIELTAMRITAAGHMVDFRYRVLDAEKAAPLFKRQTKPYLIHQESGKVLAVPNTAKVGALRNSNKPQNDRIYWMFFGNNGVVKHGDKVTVVIGDFRTENLIVE